MNCQGMFLESPSGYMVPFLLEREDDVTEIMLPYGDQVHPRTGERFFHHGVDFVCDHLPLFAVASGLVVGVGNDGERGDFIVTRYGRYQVRYCHISEAKAAYGARVTAGQEIAVSGDFLHIDVRYDGDELNPEDFLKMLFSNVSMLTALDADSFPEALTPDIPVETDYDDCREEIEALMQQWMPRYFADIVGGAYRPSENTEGTLRLLLEKAAERGYFYKDIPSLTNPLGLGADGGDVAGRVQSVLIEDFLVWLASRHGVYVPSWDDDKKKRLMKRHRLAVR